MVNVCCSFGRLIVRGLIVGVIALVYTHEATAETIRLRSGNGYGSTPTDSQVTYYAGPQSWEFDHTFVPQDFHAARTGTAAAFAYNSAWIPQLAIDPLARWISTDARGGCCDGATALYAISFNIADPTVATAVLSLYYAVDDVLGDSRNQGVFVNGSAISGNSRNQGNFSNQYYIGRDDIAPLLHQGTNTLFILATDVLGPAGLIFSATIETTPAAAVPEPSSLLLLSMGALLSHVARRRCRQVRGTRTSA